MTGRPIVVGYDNSPAATAAMRWAAKQAKLLVCDLIVVYVTSAVSEWELAAVQVDPDRIRREFTHLLETAWTAPLREQKVAFRTEVAVGRVAMELMRIARAEYAQLIVIGMTGRGTLGELVNSSTQHVLQKHAARPVVAVPEVWLDDLGPT